MNYDSIPDFGSLYDSVPIYQTRADVAFYVDEAVNAGGRVLELGCGTGRILLPIARARCDIVGLDRSREMLRRCRAKLESESAEVRSRVTLIEGDARDFTVPGKFALVIAPFRMMQHLITIDDQLRCLDAVARHLEPGGRFVFDVFNPNVKALASVTGEEVEDMPETMLADGRRLRRASRVKRVRWIDQVSEIEMIYDLTPVSGDRKRHVHAFDMRWYLRAELIHLLARGGFRVEQILGNVDRSPLGDASPDLIVCAAR